MKSNILLCLMMIWGSLSYCQTILVVEKKTKVPLEQVSIISNNPILNAVTNAEGQADLSAFKGLNYIEIHAFGYKTKKTSYTQLESASFYIELETALNLDELVVSPTKWQEKTDQLPTRVATVSPKTVALMNPQTAADLLGISGQVYIQKSQQGGGSPMIRGFSTNRLLYSIDGVR